MNFRNRGSRIEKEGMVKDIVVGSRACMMFV
jgi:hypothetical protein